ncbi:MAG: imidazolonepropionase [Candidatus Marinimicrobia bacterium]|nr:imidazolonepropionase [Candidatus Neomarinimicrobiota bacterium]
MRIKLINPKEIATFHTESGSVQRSHHQDILIADDRIEAIGNNIGSVDHEIDCSGRLVTPGFVDPHTHPVFWAGREMEFAQRIAGASYQEIAAQGGGIQSSIAGVRNADHNDLKQIVRKRLDRFLKLGTTTIEAKSGYGLTTAAELKSLAILGELADEHPLDIVSTFLGAHAFPAEYSDDHDAYVDLLCDEMIPAVAEQGIAEFCDVFCENGYFTVEQSRKILNTARNYELIPRLHADEFEDSGAAELASEVRAISADHLMAVSPAGMAALEHSGVIATLLPGTTFFLGQNTYAPARELLDRGIRVALATDFNPGSSHIQSMPFIISLACLYLGMTVEEAFAAATYHAAQALGRQNDLGTLEPGKKADLIIWNIGSLLEIPYHVTDLPIHNVIKEGQPIFELD